MTAKRAAPTACQRGARVRAAATRRNALSVAKPCSMGLESGESGGRKSRVAPAASIAGRTAGPLWTARVSKRTVSPGRTGGPHPCLTSVWKARPSRAPGSSSGAVRPAARKPVMTVVVLQWPCGRLATSRSPRRQRPCHRASLVVRPVSSRKTNRVGASVGGRVPQASRAVFPAGRCCSCAGPVFFCL